jgi:hypothetical protein
VFVVAGLWTVEEGCLFSSVEVLVMVLVIAGLWTVEEGCFFSSVVALAIAGL